VQIPVDPLDAAALAAAVTPGQERFFRQRLEADWDGDGTWDHTYSDLTGIQPVVRLAEEHNDSTPGSDVTGSGASASELTIDMNGSILVGAEYMPVAEGFMPYNTASPLYGIEVPGTQIRWSVAIWTTRGWITTLLFTGWIDKRDVQRSSNRVTLTAINIPPKLRDPTFWPPWAVDGPAAARLNTYDPQRGLASSVVDAICNAAGLRTRPRPPWQSHSGVVCLSWLPLCGSFAPAAGRMLSQHPWGNFQFFPVVFPISPARDPSGEYWVTGPFGLARNAKALYYPGSLLYTTRDQQPEWIGMSTSITAWMWCGPTAPGYTADATSTLFHPCAAIHFGYVITTNYYAQRLTLASNGTSVQIQVEAGTNLIYRGSYTPASDAWRHVHVQLDHSTTPPTCKMFVDGVQQVSFSVTGASNSEAATALNVLFLPQVGLRVSPGVRMSDVIAWQEVGSPTVVPERTVFGGVGAVIDRSLNEITHVPPPGDPGWDTIKGIASAEYAVLHIDPDGTLRFINRDNARLGTDESTLTLSVPKEVGMVDSEDGRANAARISAQPGEASWKLAWEAPAVDTIVAPPGVTEYIFPIDEDVIAIESGTVPALYQSAESANPLPAWSGKVNSGYVFVFDGTETEELVDQNMVNLTDQSGLEDKQLMRIKVTNSSTSNGRFRLKDDAVGGTDPQPALRIAGYILVRPPVENSIVTSDANVIADGQQRTINLTGGDWRQHLGSVEDSAYYVLGHTTQRIATFDRFEVPGDPRRELADPYLLTLGTSGQRIRGFSVGIQRVFDNRGYRDTLDIRATHGPGRWVLDDTVLGVLESTAIVG
jgi:hypothetical protein